MKNHTRLIFAFLAGLSFGSYFTYAIMKRREESLQKVVEEPVEEKKTEVPTERKYQEHDEHFAERERPTDDEPEEEEESEESDDEDVPFQTELTAFTDAEDRSDIFEIVDISDYSGFDEYMDADVEEYYLTLPDGDLTDESGDPAEIHDLFDDNTCDYILQKASEYVSAIRSGGREFAWLEKSDAVTIKNHVLGILYEIHFAYTEEEEA